MNPISEGSLLWRPTPEVVENANLTHYMRWLTAHRNLSFHSYPELWRWSVDHLEDFWGTMWEYFAFKASKPASRVLGKRTMPGAEWFVDMEMNWAENVLQKRTDTHPMLLYKAENEDLIAISWQAVYEQASRLAQVLRESGVKKGDRVVAYMPNIPETIVAVLATASLGAIWSSCSPDFGSRSVLDRFSQIEPKVLVAVNGYSYGGKPFDRCEVIAELQAGLPSLEKTILIPHANFTATGFSDTTAWDEALSSVATPDEMLFEQVPFNYPLWVLYSSGTTGLPKPIVHGHGGVLIEHAKATVLHNDLKPRDRFFWYSSTGWMMWNYLVGSLLSGCTAVLYNGSPGYPDMNALFQLAEETGMTYFGTSAAFVNACIKAEIRPNIRFDLSKIRGVGSTGSPLTVPGFQWVYENINHTLALESLSGGTDLCTAFVGGVRTLPIHAGEIQGASLGANVQAFDEAGKAVVGEVGELVITQPMPSMPLFFWNDPGNVRYLESYFEMYPGIWRHGDWIKFNARGGCVIYGRSDSTINRQGVRMGTSEIYQAVESLPEITDSLIIDLESLGRDSYMPLFVVLREGVELCDDLVARLKAKIRRDVSPRHVPDEIFVIEEVPYTLSGKKMEVPIRKILLGQDVGKAANPGAMRNPRAIAYFEQLAKRLSKT